MFDHVYSRNAEQFRTPVSLGDAITGIDDGKDALLVRAVLHTSGRRQSR
jgi:hypothetical protein